MVPNNFQWNGTFDGVEFIGKAKFQKSINSLENVGKSQLPTYCNFFNTTKFLIDSPLEGASGEGCNSEMKTEKRKKKEEYVFFFVLPSWQIMLNIQERGLFDVYVFKQLDY